MKKKKVIMVISCILTLAIVNFFIFVKPARADSQLCYGQHNIICPYTGKVEYRCDCRTGDVCDVSGQIPCELN